MISLICASMILMAPAQTAFSAARFGGYDLLGAYKSGHWIKAVDAKRLWKPVDSMDAIFGLKPSRRAKLSLTPPKDTEYSTFGGELTPALDDEVGAWFLVQGVKNPSPRTLTQVSRTHPTYRKAIAEALAKNRLKGASARLTQAYRCDLNGDKVDEVILVARSRETIIEQRRGDYSALVVRHVVKGKAKQANLIVNVYGKGIERTPLEDSMGEDIELAGVLDLDGDGKMELVAVADMYESFEFRVFTFDGKKFRQVLTMAGGV